jgi:hypothetical protein
MTETIEEQDAAGAVDPGEAAYGRSLLLVAGSGRSGTSLFTGIVQRLGFYVPQPEVPADETNPRGFAESLWVVEFHTDLLRNAGIHVSDARPSAWASTTEINLRPRVQRRLARWLTQQFRRSDDVVIKDPRLSWFLPLWRRCGEQLGASPRFVTVLRHPAAVIDSKQRWYGAWRGEVSRAAGWLNQTLFTERATRGAPRAFVRYDDLLDDWTKEVGRIGTSLDLRVVRDAPVQAMRSAHEFVDKSLSRSRPNWEEARIPAALRAQVDEVWELVSRLVDAEDPDDPSLAERLDAARAAYVELYEEAEAIAQSSVVGGGRRSGSVDGEPPSRVVAVARRVPLRFRRKIPVRWRRAARRILVRRPGS